MREGRCDECGQMIEDGGCECYDEFEDEEDIEPEDSDIIEDDVKSLEEED